MRKINRFAAGLLALTTCFGCILTAPQAAISASAEIIHNPIMWADVPDDDIIRVGDTYYMVSTTMYFSPGAPIMKSKDLVSWEICSYVYDTLADGDVQKLTNGKHDYGHGQWAASLRYKDGVFYCFFGSYGTNKSYIFKTTDPETSNWDRVELNGMYHDASILLDDDGRNYLVYGGGGEIKIKEFNAEMTGFKMGGLDKTLFKTNLTGLAGEGSHIQKIGDYYYVFVIAWPNGHPRIELCYRSKEIGGYYEGKTVLESGVGSYGSGVAQGGIVDTPDGEWYGLLFQDHGAVGRIPVLVPVTWQDGWPMMGVNGKAPLTLDIDTAYTGANLACDDEFDSDTLKLEWQWNHNPDNKSWSLTEREGWLRLHTVQNAKSLLHARNTLTMRTEGPACSGAVKVDASGMKPGDRAGISAFQYKYGCVGVLVDDSGAKKIYYANNGGYGGDDVMGSYDAIKEQVPMSGDEAYFKVDFRFANVTADGSASNNIDKVNFYYSLDGMNWTKIGEEIGMDYNLKLFTGYRSGLYCYSTKQTGGYADFDYFDYEREEWNPPTAEKNEPEDPNGYLFHDTFDKGLCGWTGRGSAKVSVSTDVTFDSSAGALHATDRDKDWNGATKQLSRSKFKAGQSYSFSVNACYTEGTEEEDTLYLKLQYVGADEETHYETIDEQLVKKGDWVQLANSSYPIPEGASNVYIYVETIDTTNNFYIDEAIGAPDGTEIEGPGGGVKVPVIPGDADADGTVNAKDLTVLKRVLLTEGKFASKAAEKNADVNGDGKVDADDAKALAAYLSGES